MGSRPMFNGTPLGAAPRPPLGINQQPQQAQQPPKAWDEEMRDKTMSIFGALYKTNGTPLGAAPRPPLGINQQPQQAQQPPKAWDEEMRDKTMSIFGALYKTLSLSRGTMSAYAKSHFGFRTLCVGAGTTLAGFVEFVVNLVTGGYCGGYYALLFAGVATSAVGLGFWSAYYKKGAQEREEYLEAKKQAEQSAVGLGFWSAYYKKGAQEREEYLEAKKQAEQAPPQPQPDPVPSSMFNPGPQQDQKGRVP